MIAKHSESMEQHKELTSSAHEIEHLKLTIEKLRRMIFGRKSEKLTGELEQLEFRLEELETAQAAAAQAASEPAQTDSPQTDLKRRSRPSRKPLPEDLPREVVTHLPPHTNCPDCGGVMRQFGLKSPWNLGTSGSIINCLTHFQFEGGMESRVGQLSSTQDRAQGGRLTLADKGGPYRARTDDIHGVNVALYQLS